MGKLARFNSFDKVVIEAAQHLESDGMPRLIGRFRPALRERRLEAHCKLTALCALAIAKQMPQLRGGEERRITRAARLHDVGKTDIPREVLLKQSKPTDEEWMQIRRHPIRGGEMLMEGRTVMPPLDPLAVEYIEFHHRRWDGGGYGQKAAGNDIPLGARIISVADAYATMMEARGREYRAFNDHEETMREIIKNSGTQFDPKVVDALCKAVGWEKA